MHVEEEKRKLTNLVQPHYVFPSIPQKSGISALEVICEIKQISDLIHRWFRLAAASSFQRSVIITLMYMQQV